MVTEKVQSSVYGEPEKFTFQSLSKSPCVSFSGFNADDDFTNQSFFAFGCSFVQQETQNIGRVIEALAEPKISAGREVGRSAGQGCTAVHPKFVGTPPYAPTNR